MSNLLDSLELGEVDSANVLPEGKYAGVVRSSNYVYMADKNIVSHVIGLRVTEGKHTGLDASKWFRLYENPTFEEGHEGDVNHIVNPGTSLMTDNNRAWYKKTWEDIGVDPAPKEGPKPTVEDLVGKPVSFGYAANKQGYLNVTFIQARKETSATANTPVSGLL